MPKPQEQGLRSWGEPLTSRVQSQRAEARVAEDNPQDAKPGICTIRPWQEREFKQQTIPAEWVLTSSVGAKMDAERLRESLRQQGLLGYLDGPRGFRKSKTRMPSIRY